MKMVKKILLGLAATSVILLASCKMDAGKGDTDGTKWDLTMTVDGTKIPDSVQAGENGKGPYRRYWEEFSGNEACAEIETTLTFDTEKSIMDEGVATAGLIFDLNKSDNNTVEFILVGISPSAGYYVEKYTNVPKGKAASGDDSESALVSSENYIDLDGKDHSKAYHPWASGQDGLSEYKITVTQDTPKVYTVKINGKVVSDPTAMAGLTPKKTANIKKTGTTEKKTYAVGGIACYGSVVKGNKLVVKYHTEQDAVTGKLEAEEIEE